MDMQTFQDNIEFFEEAYATTLGVDVEDIQITNIVEVTQRRRLATYTEADVSIIICFFVVCDSRCLGVEIYL